jgi:hypothetical protein
VTLPNVAGGPRSVVVLKAANASFAVAANAAPGLAATLRGGRGANPRLSTIGVLRANASHDTARVELARPLAAPGHLDVRVPAGVTLRIIGDNGGAVRVEGVGGAVEVTHSNGGVTVLGAAGHALVATSNGNIEVRLATVTPDAPMSFITSNGNIDLALPADTRMTLVIDRSAPIDSEFDLARESGQRDSGALLRLTANGGGPVLRLYTNNGIVRLRRNERQR